MFKKFFKKIYDIANKAYNSTTFAILSFIYTTINVTIDWVKSSGEMIAQMKMVKESVDIMKKHIKLKNMMA